MNARYAKTFIIAMACQNYCTRKLYVHFFLLLPRLLIFCSSQHLRGGDDDDDDQSEYLGQIVISQHKICKCEIFQHA